MTDLPATLVEKRAALVAARASGVRSVRFGEDEVTYKSDTEMAAAIRFLDGEIASHGRRPKVFTFSTSKGF